MFAKCNECGADVDVLSVGEVLKMMKESNSDQATMLIGSHHDPIAAVFFVTNSELIIRLRDEITNWEVGNEQ